jgi:hypothetical protein
MLLRLAKAPPWERIGAKNSTPQRIGKHFFVS